VENEKKIGAGGGGDEKKNREERMAQMHRAGSKTTRIQTSEGEEAHRKYLRVSLGGTRSHREVRMGEKRKEVGEEYLSQAGLLMKKEHPGERLWKKVSCSWLCSEEGPTRDYLRLVRA